MRLGLTFALSALVVFAASTASAQRHPVPGGLERYSDASLLREMSYRGYSCEDSQSAPATVVAVSCDQYTNMMIDLYTEGGARITQAKYFMGSAAKCETEKARISAEVGRRLFRAKAVAFCDPYTNVIKLQVTTSTISETEKTFTGTAARCEQSADDFNEMF